MAPPARAARHLTSSALGALLLTLLLGAFGAGLSGCAAEDLSPVYSDIAVCTDDTDDSCEPPFDLGPLRFGDTHTLEIFVRNRGTGMLHPTVLEVVSGEGVSPGELPADVRPAHSAAIALTIDPTAGATTVRLAVSSDDPDQPTYEFDLMYEGVAPVLVVCPGDDVAALGASCGGELHVDLGEVLPTQARDATFIVRNAGTSELRLRGVSIDDGTTAPGGVEFRILTSTSAGRLEIGTESVLIARYAPSDALADTYSIHIQPDDDTTPEAVIHLSGRTPPNSPPQAVAVETVTQAVSVAGEVGQALWFDGRASADPEGDPLRFDWTVVAAPAGSSAQPESPSATVTRFVPDVLGVTILQLQVHDALGQVDFEDLTLAIEPRDRLTVSATWGTDAGDVDLHLVPSGDALFGASDCYFGRTQVDWGALAETRDDPELLTDVETGDGSERITIRRPADGQYDVWLHYFDDRGGRVAQATVSVLRDDGSVEVGTTTLTLGQTCDAVLAGTVSWPEATFVAALGSPVSVCP